MVDLNAFFDFKKKEVKVKKKYPVGKYLVATFLYYHCDFSVMEDEEFDKICKELFDNFDDINHPHKHLLDRDSLQAGSGYQLRLSDFPTIVKSISYSILEYHRQGRDYFQEIGLLNQ